MQELNTLLNCFHKLREYCEKEDYKGYDVSDSIASPILTRTFLKNISAARFLFIQLTGHRLAFINLRPLLFIPKFYNAKGISLFLNGYCNIYDIINEGYNIGITKNSCKEKIIYLADMLLSLSCKDYSGACWGYPTAWQSRKFYFPPETPTVVATAFAVESLFHAYEVTKIERYKDMALSASNFILNDLIKTETKHGIFLSYSPLSGNNLVHNASLLGARTLSQCYKYSHSSILLDIAKKVVNNSVALQHSDGSWIYGEEKYQSWIDNFHTGYNIDAINTYKVISDDKTYDNAIRIGFDYMINNHFDKQSIPKYFHDKQYPIDIHCCGEIFVVLYKLNMFESHHVLAENIFSWSLSNMWDKNMGFFYFQKHKYITNKASLMRWNQAFMFNALSFYLKSLLKWHNLY